MREILSPNDIPENMLSLYDEYLLAEMRELCKDSLLAFQTTFWNVLEPTTVYKDNWHIHYMIEHLEAVECGQIKRLLLNLPPRNMKSILTSVMFGAWLWARKPEWRMLSFSYADALSKKFNIDRRNILTSSLYRQLFPHVILSADMNTQKRIDNTRTGMMLASPMPGTATGLGGDLLIVDDPHDPKGAESDLQRQTTVDYFRTTLQSRLNDQSTGRIVVVMQRLHEMDVSGLCIDLGDYVHVKLPSEEREDRTLIFPMSKRTIHRKRFDILWEEHQSKSELESLEKTMGDYAYAGQYLQEPAPPDGGLVKEEWWQWYSGVVPEPITRYCVSVDAAFKKSDTSDYVVIMRLGIAHSGNMYILDMTRQRMTFLETCDAIMAMRKPRDIIYIEEKANGAAIIDTLRTKKKITGIIPVIPKESKIARLQAVTPWIESGAVYLPQYAAWKEVFLKEFKMFPNGQTDDIVDALSQAIWKIKYMQPAEGKRPRVDTVRTFGKEDVETQDAWEKEIFSLCAGEFTG
jgi:predicted phage terminase large subunit-like protein